MPEKPNLPQRITALLVYGRPPLVFFSMLCAFAVMWRQVQMFYHAGVFFLLVAMSFDLLDGWFAARFPPHPTLSNLAERILDKVVYSIIFPLVAVGMMWRLGLTTQEIAKPHLLHAILVLLLCITVLVRDNFAHFIRSFAIQKGIEPETKEFATLRTLVAAPVGALLYIHAFYLPGSENGTAHSLLASVVDLPLRFYFIIEIIFLIINFGSIAALCRKYGTFCLDEVCLEDERLRFKILAFFPNSLTVMNAMMGLLAIFFAHLGRIREAYLFLLGAAIFDKLDGALARKLGLTEQVSQQDKKSGFSVGAILDDIADGISFCLVPALVFYLALSRSPILEITSLPLELIAGFYGLLGVCRLIYFTVDKSPIPGFFKGMPTPAAALLVISPLLMYSQALESGLHYADAVFWANLSVVLMITAALAMNCYPLHYLHLGRYMDRHSWFGRLNIFLLLSSVFTPYFGYVALIYLLLYLVSPVITRRLEPDKGKRTDPDSGG